MQRGYGVTASIGSLGLSGEGSTPSSPHHMSLWCNGSTLDLGSSSGGSNPSGDVLLRFVAVLQAESERQDRHVCGVHTSVVEHPSADRDVPGWIPRFALTHFRNRAAPFLDPSVKFGFRWPFPLTSASEARLVRCSCGRGRRRRGRPVPFGGADCCSSPL